MAKTTGKVAEFVTVEDGETRLRVVCAAIQRLAEAGLTVAVRAADDEQAERIDDLLWTFSDSAFIPHVRARHAPEPVIEPVLIFAGPAQEGSDALVHVAGGAPDEGACACACVVDFADVYDEELRDLSRRRYATLKDAGYRMRYIR